ncbi:Protein kinase-like domain [Pseudocohnilembus persalinus]|uniref:Protein kinase-like domain n=1 Tax=Pseudocohnilembus persalinus TaxID=266149 RepID=A0A0V0QNN4_PSEPJ|nr:Protein kinase-like domain [Pseudocohnilembus persalinus]|eukprot:KRX03961.1 Protein kinase-like domain [Pseudocohnilembus persalinus]
MKKLIQTVSDSQNLKDATAIGRGLYRCVQGLSETHSNSVSNAFFEEQKQYMTQDIKEKADTLKQKKQAENNNKNQSEQQKQAKEHAKEFQSLNYKSQEKVAQEYQDYQNKLYEEMKQKAFNQMSEIRKEQELKNKKIQEKIQKQDSQQDLKTNQYQQQQKEKILNQNISKQESNQYQQAKDKTIQGEQDKQKIQENVEKTEKAEKSQFQQMNEEASQNIFDSVDNKSQNQSELEKIQKEVKNKKLDYDLSKYQSIKENYVPQYENTFKVKNPLEGLNFQQRKKQQQQEAQKNQDKNQNLSENLENNQDKKFAFQNLEKQDKNNQKNDLKKEKVEEENELDFDEVFGYQGQVGREQKVPDGSFSRAYNFGILGLNLAGSTISSWVTSPFSKEKPKSHIFNEKNAAKISDNLCKMRGAALKIGQFLSIQDDSMVPKEIKMAFEKARKSADIMPKSQLYYMLETELGENWKDNFLKFDEMPIAAASIGQVHRAQLKNGKFVAIKIQYPGVKESIDSDLNNFKRVFAWTGLAPKSMFIDQMIANHRVELLEECDYKSELLKQDHMRNLVQEDRRYYVPKIYEELSTERVFTQEFIVGDSFEKICNSYSQEKRNEIGSRIMNLTLQELFDWHYMQTDPNPSNFFFNEKKDVLYLLDFGACHTYSEEFMDGYIELVHGAIQNDIQTIVDKSIQLGFLNGKEAKEMVDAQIKTIQSVAEPFMKNEEFNFHGTDITSKTKGLMPVIMKYRIKSPPPETYSLHRKFSGAFLLNIRLGSKINCHKQFMDLYQKHQQKKKLKSQQQKQSQNLQ